MLLLNIDRNNEAREFHSLGLTENTESMSVFVPSQLQRLTNPIYIFKRLTKQLKLQALRLLNVVMYLELWNVI